MLENNPLKSRNRNQAIIAVLIILCALLLIGAAFYLGYFKKSSILNPTDKTGVSKNNPSEARVVLSGVVEKLDVETDGKSGTLFIKTAAGLPQDNKPMVVYQVQVDDSVLVNSISPAKSASETKPVSVPIKWKDIKVNKYINVNLNKELGSATVVKLSSIKNIEVIEN